MTGDLAAVQLTRMQLSDLDDVIAIERNVYSHPWSINSFIDALANHYEAWVLRAADGELLGYFVHMTVLDESHLLTIAVKASMQRRGLGVYLLRQLVQQARHHELGAVLLEVRVSNSRALKLYQTFGFVAVGRRKNYYQVNPEQREDALILQYQIPEVESCG